MKIICIDPRNNPLWQTLTGQYSSDIFHSPEWIQVLSQTYDFDIRALVITNSNGRPRSGIVYSRIEDMMDPRIISLPFSDFCDPLVETGEDWMCLADRLSAEKCSITVHCLHNEIPLSGERFNLVKKAKWHCVNLEQDLDTIWQNIHSSARRAIRKAEKTGIIVRIAQGKEDLRAFFEMHLKVRKHKYRLVAQPYAFFENIWDNFIERDKGALMVAVHDGEIIGGVLFIEWQNKLYYKFNASNPEYVALRPNDLVVWEGIKYGQARQAAYLDFGRTDWDHEGLLRYKRKFSSEEKTISVLNYKPNGVPSQKDKQIRNLFPQLTDLFTREAVPDEVTEKAGNILYRYFT